MQRQHATISSLSVCGSTQQAAHSATCFYILILVLILPPSCRCTCAAALESALAEARHQLGCWEQDVMALEFVAKHEGFDDICDLDMTYNNSHLEVSNVRLLVMAGCHCSSRI